MSMLQVGTKTDNSILLDDHRTFEERQIEIEKMKAAEEKTRKMEKQSPYKNWYQFNKAHTKNAIWLASNHPKAYAILLFLLDQMDEYNAVMCSYQVLQEALEVSQVTVARSVKILKEKGFVAILKSGTSNIYVINDDLAWSSWSTNKKYCKFPTNVVLSATENQDYLDKVEQAKFKTLSVKDDE